MRLGRQHHESDLMGLDVNAYGQFVPQRQWADLDNKQAAMPDSWIEDSGPWLFVLFLLVLVIGACFFFST